MKLDIKEISMPYDMPSKGRLFAGTPSRGKPKAMNPEEWSCRVADLALTGELGWKNTVAIPLSFWPKTNRYELARKYTDANLNCISYIDEPGQWSEQQHETPAGWGGSRTSLSGIIESLEVGEDVLVLSNTRAVSGFLPAVLSLTAHPDCHLVKILYPIAVSQGYLLTPEQIAYVSGLADANQNARLNVRSGKQADAW